MNVFQRIGSRMRNVFSNNQNDYKIDYGQSIYDIPTNYKQVSSYAKESLTHAIINRIALDVCSCTFQHVKVHKNNEDRQLIDSELNYCLTVEANIDQSAISFMHDVAYSLLDEGSIAVVPIDTEIGGNKLTVDICSLRVGKIVKWYPQHVKVSVYNEKTGKKEEIIKPKRQIAIIENPLWSVFNSSNATLNRIKKKLGQSDNIDNMISSPSFNGFFQFPHSTKDDLRKSIAKKRIEEFGEELKNSPYGITYIDGTEKFTQLSKPLSNHINETVDNLWKQFFNETGLTEKVFNGTANEEEMLIYQSRTVDPILKFILFEFNRKFFSKEEQKKGHKIEIYKELFKFTSVEKLAHISDTFRRNYILTSNEIRSLLNYRTSNDPRADELFNPNIADSNQMGMEGGFTDEMVDQMADQIIEMNKKGGENQNE